jgi:hypothetical protein
VVDVSGLVATATKAPSKDELRAVVKSARDSYSLATDYGWSERESDLCVYEALYRAGQQSMVSALVLVEEQREAALKLHNCIDVWMNTPDANYSQRQERGDQPDYQVCEYCSDDEVVYSIEDGDFSDDVSFVPWPCATVRALGGGETESPRNCKKPSRNSTNGQPVVARSSTSKCRSRATSVD